jgi:hypothetical protein
MRVFVCINFPILTHYQIEQIVETLKESGFLNGE